MSVRSEAKQFRMSRYFFWITFFVAAITSIGLGANRASWAAFVAIAVMGLYLLASRLWTPVVLKHEDFADSFYFLGFLLTLVALVATLVGLQDVSDGEVQGLVLGRFGLALATTIFGLATRTALRMFQESADDSLTDATARAQEALKRAAEELRVVLQNASTDMETTLDSATARIGVAAGGLTTRLNGLSEGIVQAGERLQPWSDAMETAEAGTRTWSDSLGAANSKATSFTERMDEVRAGLVRLESSVEKSTQGLTSLSSSATHAAERAKALQDSSEAIHGSFEALRHAIAGLDDLPEMSDGIEKIAAALRGGEASVERFSRSVSGAGAALERVRTESEAVTLEGLNELSKVARAEAVAVEGVLERWRGALAELAVLTKQLGEREAKATQALVSVEQELSAGVQYLTRVASEREA